MKYLLIFLMLIPNLAYSDFATKITITDGTYDADVTADEALKVDASGSSLTVSGTTNVGNFPTGFNVNNTPTVNVGNTVTVTGTLSSSTVIATTSGASNVTVTSAGTPVQFANHTCKYVLITANEANTDIVVIGDSGVDATEATRTGMVLFSGQTEKIEISNTNALYIDAEVNGEGASYAYFN